MKRGQTEKEKNMKNLLMTIGAAALVAITFNVSGALLSPRAAGNQITTVPAVTTVSAAPTAGLVSPRALGNQSITVATVTGDVNPALACRSMVASPKAIQACAANATMPGCKLTVADNKTP